MVEQCYYQDVLSGRKKSRFIKEQEVNGLLSNLGIKTPLNEMPFFRDILF